MLRLTNLIFGKLKKESTMENSKQKAKYSKAKVLSFIIMEKYSRAILLMARKKGWDINITPTNRLI